MLHLRIIAPSGRSAAVRHLLTASTAVTHVVVLPGAAVDPQGDLFTVEVEQDASRLHGFTASRLHGFTASRLAA